MIFASSGATVAGWERVEPYRSLAEGRYDDAPAEWTLIRHDMATRPRGVYGATKVWGEAIARHFADTTPLSVICIRIGFVNAADRPSRPRDYAVWCSKRDIAEAIACSVSATAELKFDVFFANSRNRWGYRDLTHAEKRSDSCPTTARKTTANRTATSLARKTGLDARTPFGIRSSRGLDTFSMSKSIFQQVRRRSWTSGYK